MLEEYGQPLQIREVEIPEIGPRRHPREGGDGRHLRHRRPPAEGRADHQEPAAQHPGSRDHRPHRHAGRGPGPRTPPATRSRSATASCGRMPIAASATGARSPATRSCARGGRATAGRRRSLCAAASPSTSTSLPPRTWSRCPRNSPRKRPSGVGCAFRTVIGGYERFGKLGLMEDVVIQGCGAHRSLLHRRRPRERRPHHHRGRRSQEPAGAWPSGGERTTSSTSKSIPIAEERKQDDPGADPGTGSGERGRSLGRTGGLRRRPGHHPEGRASTWSWARPPPTSTPIIVQPHQREGASPSSAASRRQSFTSTRPCSSSRPTGTKYPFAEIVSGTYQLEDINRRSPTWRRRKEIKPVIDNRDR